MRRFGVLVVAIALAALSTPVLAQSDIDLCLRVQASADVDLSDASAVQDGIGSGTIVVTKVLTCDAVTGASASSMPTSDVGTGAWRIQPINVDALTDERSTFISILPESEAPSSGLWIGCADGSTTVTVGWGSPLGSERIIDVQTRIGDGEVTKDQWLNRGDDYAVYGGVDTGFVRSLFGETRLALRISTPESGEITAVFDITGIENAVVGVRETCGW